MTAAGSTEVMAGTAFGVDVATAPGVADVSAIDGVVDEGVGGGAEPAGVGAARRSAAREKDHDQEWAPTAWRKPYREARGRDHVPSPATPRNVAQG